jgi:hypothetical protein
MREFMSLPGLRRYLFASGFFFKPKIPRLIFLFSKVHPNIPYTLKNPIF